MGKDERERACVRAEWRKGVGGKWDIGAEKVKSESGKELHEREMCVRTGVRERLSCTITQRY